MGIEGQLGAGLEGGGVDGLDLERRVADGNGRQKEGEEGGVGDEDGLVGQSVLLDGLVDLYVPDDGVGAAVHSVLTQAADG